MDEPGERRTTAVEMLWDLVFVFAVTQVSTLLRRDTSWAGFGRAMLVLALVWWAWSAFVFAVNAEDGDAPVTRNTVLAATVLIFLAGLAVPRAFGGEGALFAITYACVRLLYLGLYVDAARRGNARMASIGGFAFTIVVGLALLLAGAFVHGSGRVALWAPAVAIDLCGPGIIGRRRIRGLQSMAVEHFAERYGLFIIICLGESVAGIGIGASGHAPSAAAVAGVGLTLLITVGLWWTYFDRVADMARERLAVHPDPVVAATDAYAYAHLILVAGIIIFAVGARDAVTHIDAPLTDAARLTLCAGVAVYLLGHAAFRRRLIGDWPVPNILAAAACLLVFAVSAHGHAWIPAAGVSAVLAALVAWEAR
ncbi:MAG TPA: low temperature requirement protein A [Solirubrobacteraceae bacterium]|jgi:low temperature requirement protein LtrA|nr:low temperature requirement protein A [Solirubrobacteraceae bacterium]